MIIDRAGRYHRTLGALKSRAILEDDPGQDTGTLVVEAKAVGLQETSPPSESGETVGQAGDPDRTDEEVDSLYVRPRDGHGIAVEIGRQERDEDDACRPGQVNHAGNSRGNVLGDAPATRSLTPSSSMTARG